MQEQDMMGGFLGGGLLQRKERIPLLAYDSIGSSAKKCFFPPPPPFHITIRETTTLYLQVGNNISTILGLLETSECHLGARDVLLRVLQVLE